MNDKVNDSIVKPLNIFSFRSVTPFRTKFKTTIKKNNKSLPQQSLLLNDTAIKSDDEFQNKTHLSVPIKFHKKNLTQL